MIRLKHIITVFLISVFILCLAGCSSEKQDVQSQLLSRLPKMDQSCYNRFLFDMSIIGSNTDDNGREFYMSGALETFKNISHMYNLDISIDDQKYKAQSWTDFDNGIRYINKGNGFTAEHVEYTCSIQDLATVLNTHNGNIDVTDNTLSWIFDTDSIRLFGDFIDEYADKSSLSGNGRITAVFDQDTLDFKYFNIVVSANTPDRASVLLDAVLYWDDINGSEYGLAIPNDVSDNAYETATGIISSGYDTEINPLAESFIQEYGGFAEIAVNDNGSSMFWTYETDDMSASVNYSVGNHMAYTESKTFFESLYGKPVEELENEAYFYKEQSGELVWITEENGRYVQAVITGQGMTQGQLRKPLIAYRARLGI